MEACTVKPYNGKEGYIFVSFCHEDEYRVYPIIEELALKGYRIWYDRGIAPGESWPEVISERLNSCEVFLIAQTAAADASHNCRNEINLAVSLEKTILGVQLEEIKLSLAMRLQLGDVQWVSATKHKGGELIKEICRCKELKKCIGSVDPDVKVLHRSAPVKEESKPSISSINPFDYGKTTIDSGAEVKSDSVDLQSPSSANQGSSNNGAPIKLNPVQSKDDIKEKIGNVGFDIAANNINSQNLKAVPLSEETNEVRGNAKESNAIEATPVKQVISGTDTNDAGGKTSIISEVKVKTDGSDELGKTVILNTPNTQNDDPDKTVLMGNAGSGSKYVATLPLIIRSSTGEVFEGQPLQTVIGREKSSCDVVIPSPDRSISRAHVTLIVRNGKYYVSDMDSSNGTFIDGEKLEKGASAEVGEFTEVSLAEEKLLLLFGKTASSFKEGLPIGIIRHLGSGEARYIIDDTEFSIGRAHPWKNDCMNDNAISRNHATINRDGYGFILADSSTNGSAIMDGGECLRLSHKSAPIKTGCVLVFGNQEFEFTVIKYTLSER